jgi:serine/threonine-protein kinase
MRTGSGGKIPANIERIGKPAPPAPVSVTLAGVSSVTVGRELSGYRVDGLIGRGGMGVVYRGIDLRLGRPVAIKLIAAERAGDPIVRRRFEREARLMASLEHPNVLPVYAAGEQDGSLFLVMRYVDGIDLAALLRAEGRLPPSRAARIADQLAQALDAAHGAGLVHRDVKPANVLLAGDHVYLGDFGLGRAVEASTHLTDSGEWLGTVDFCSPEQLRGERTDARSDVYGLGCLLHTALTGVPPLHRETSAATMLAHLAEDPPPPSAADGVPPAFDPVVLRALAKRPADRYGTAGELGRAALAAAQPWAASPPLRARPRRAPGAPERTKLDLRPQHPPRGSRRSRRGVLASAAALLACLAAVAALIGTSGSTPLGPLRSTDIASVVHRFATAVAQRDARALGRVLAPEVTQVAPGAVQRGRAAVLAQYERQFADGSISGYAVANVQPQPGWVGRASAQYAVLRPGQPDLSGQIVFGVERVAGQPVIGLIAMQPAR